MKEKKKTKVKEQVKEKEIASEDFELDLGKEKKTDKVIPIKLTRNSRFRFRCHPGVRCFTACCSNVNIVLPPYDLLRIRKRLGLTAEEFFEKYATVEILAKTLLPVVTLKMRDDEKKSCPFVTPEGCTIYEDRPNICRYYPVGMATLRKKDAEGGKDEFYFMTKEDHCKGFEEEKEWTIEAWRQDQGADLYDDVNRGWMEVLIKKKSFGQREFPEIKNQMFFMVSTNIDYFRLFVLNSTFLQTYDIPEERIERIKTDDIELLKLGYEWLRHAMYAEESLKFREGVLENRKERGDAMLKKIYGQQEGEDTSGSE